MGEAEMNGMIKKAWIGLMLGLGLLAGINANAASLTITSAGLIGGNALVFTSTPIGAESAAQTVTLTADAAVGPVVFHALGISNPNFSMQDNNCADTLAISTSCTFTVKFSPETAGTRYAELTIRSDAANATNGAHTIYLQGTATKATQTVTFGPAPTILVGGNGAVTASASSGLPVTFAPTGACTVDVNTGTVTGTSAASCTITATQAGNANYTAASAQQTFNINNLATQAITNLTVPTISVGGTGTVTATGGASGNAVTFTSQTTPVCTLSGTNNSTVTGVSAGPCIIAANQAGNGSYSAATQVTANGTVNSKSSQSITFGTAPTVTVGGTGSVSASASSGLTVSFSSTTTGVCTISGSTVTGVSAGTCTIAADQAGNGSYNPAAQVPQSFTVAAAPVEPPAGELCTQYGLTTNNELTRVGNTSKYKTITTAQGYSFAFTTGAEGEVGQTSTNYSSTAQYITLSKNKCDYAPALEPKCAKQGMPPLIYYKVGGTSYFQCILEPNTTYYVNVRNASRDATTKAFTNLCSGTCNFMIF